MDLILIFFTELILIIMIIYLN